MKSAKDPAPDAEELQEVLVPIRTDEECKKAYELNRHPIEENLMFCAGYRAGGKDACYGQFLKCRFHFICESWKHLM